MKNDELQQINDVIYKNSYVKCVGCCEQELNRVSQIKREIIGPIKTMMVFDDHSTKINITKREVYFYKEDEDLDKNSISYASEYLKNVKGKIGRNDRCICGSGKKYKHCCLRKYERIASIIYGVQNPAKVSYSIPDSKYSEKSIEDYQGSVDKISNKKDRDILEQLNKIIMKENNE